MACSYTFFAIFLMASISIVSGQDLTIFFPANNGSMSWTNNDDSIPGMRFADGTIARVLLVYGLQFMRATNSLGHACGFFCSSPSSCQFGVAFVEAGETSLNKGTPPQLVWSANHDRVVGENASLEYSRGNLILKDSKGTKVWSTGTASMPVGMTIAANPNLVLFDSRNQTVWQSFDHPTNTLAPGQRLQPGQNLKSGLALDSSSSNLFILSISNNQLTASAYSDGWIPYLVLGEFNNSTTAGDTLMYVSVQEGRLKFTFKLRSQTLDYELQETSWLPEFHFLRLDPEGSLKIYRWEVSKGWMMIYDFMARRDQCQLPLWCGQLGVCYRGQCSCPKAKDGVEYFRPWEASSPQRGCVQTGKFTSEDRYELVDFGNLSYFAYGDPDAAAAGIRGLNDCKMACIGRTSCQAVFFQYESAKFPFGRCYLPSNVLSIRGEEDALEKDGSSSAYLKVRVPLQGLALAPPPMRNAQRKQKHLIPAIIFAPVFCVSLVILIAFLWRRKAAKHEEDVVEQVQGMPIRFSYKELCLATGEFSEKIGKGGFGTVFRGVLKDGTLVAVKRLENNGQVMEEFLTEVRTIGSVHHINLVQLIGFCAEKSHKLLVYEYMCNGSLDTWIFGTERQQLDWQTKRKIIVDVARGLSYLHDGCRQRIAHLDVKPQNILLDDKFNAKISDFGLAKLIDRDRNRITATVRGTLGYLAPEWQVSEHITVNADIYSFGIVLLEILCGRKNLDYSQEESSVHLLSLLIQKMYENRIADIVQWSVREVYSHALVEELEEEAMRLFRVGIWCLHYDYRKRPSMSTIVNLLEGAVDFDSHNVGRSVPCNIVPSINTTSFFSSQT